VRDDGDRPGGSGVRLSVSPSWRWRLAGIAAVSLAAAALLWLDHRASTYTDRTSRRVALEAQRLARQTLAVAPLADEASFARAEAALVATAASRAADDAEREAIAGAVRTAVGLVRAWSSGDPDVYLAWAGEHGMSLAPGLPIFGAWRRELYAQFYEAVVGRSMPASIPMERFFRDYFSAYFARWGGALQPAEIAVDPVAVIARVDPLTHWSETISTDADVDANPLGGDFWLGRIVYGGMMLVWPDDTLPAGGADERTRVEGDRWVIGTLHDAKRLMFDSIIREHGEVLAAEVRLVYRGGSGVYVPLAVWLRRRPRDGMWQPTGLSLNNVDGSVGVLPGVAYAAPY